VASRKDQKERARQERVAADRAAAEASARRRRLQLRGGPVAAIVVAVVVVIVATFYNGALYQDNPRNIPLGRYTQIQLDDGSPLIAPEKVSFAGTGL